MLLKKVKKFIEENELFHQGNRVLVAVSGGLDSVVLLDILERLKKVYDLKIYVSHYDHKLRKDSLYHALFVYQLCKEKKLPLFITSSPVGAYAEREKISLEMAGRELRYRIWYYLAKTYDLQKIALAHHLDDLAEEIFMRIIRGTGRRGLTGIPVKRENLIVRPLLFLTKDEIRRYAIERNLIWQEDPTNKDLRFLRNKIRHLLIPYIEKEFNPKIKESLKKTAAIIAEEEELIEELARKAYQDLRKMEEKDILLKLPELKKIPKPIRRRVYFLAFQDINLPLFRITSSQIEQIESLLSGKAKGPVSLPGAYCVYRGPGHLRLTFKTEPIQPFAISIAKPGLYATPLGPISVEVLSTEMLEKENITPSEEFLALAKEKLPFPFVIRTRRPGDRLYFPRIGHKKLKKFLWEKKVPPHERGKIIIIEKDGEIVSLWGLYVNPKFMVDSKTKEIILLKKSKK